jgi:hypothetical protein
MMKLMGEPATWPSFLPFESTISRRKAQTHDLGAVGGARRQETIKAGQAAAKEVDPDTFDAKADGGVRKAT